MRKYTKIERKCLECENIFYIHLFRKDDNKRGKFCSKNCYWKNMKGRKLPEDTVNKIILGQSKIYIRRKMLITAYKKGHKPDKPYLKGHLPWNTGIKRPEITGEKHPNWAGGVGTINEQIRKSLEYKLVREACYKRDNHTCQECQIRGGELNMHHIKPFALFPELYLALDNVVTLCISCHRKTDTWGYSFISKIKKHANQ